MRQCANYLMLFLMLGGCTARPEKLSPYIVDVPIIEICIQKVIDLPLYYSDDLSIGASDTDKLKAVLADLKLDKAYITSLRAQLNQCASG